MNKEYERIPAGDLRVGDTWEGPKDVTSPTGWVVREVVPVNTGAVLVLFENERWKKFSIVQGLLVQRLEWWEYSLVVEREINSVFAPGYDLEAEHIKPLWDLAADQIRDHREQMCLADLEGGNPDVTSKDDYDKSSARMAAIQRTVGAFEMLLYGETNRRAL